MRVKYLILGAGPTGLGAANRLAELGENDFLVLERHPYVGGLAASFADRDGYTWDVGGHVVFSHYQAFDRLLDELLLEGGDELAGVYRAYVSCERVAYDAVADGALVERLKRLKDGFLYLLTLSVRVKGMAVKGGIGLVDEF